MPFIIVVILCFTLISVVRAQSDVEVFIQGTVSHHSPGGILPVGIPVNLQFFSEAQWTSIYTTTVDENGSFIFSGIDEHLGSSFVTHVEYQGVDYFSEPQELVGQQQVEISIYESTNDVTGIQVDQVHIFIVPKQNVLQVAEYYLIGNKGNETYIGNMDITLNGRTTIHFKPPEDALNLTFDGPGLGERFLGSADNFADTWVIPPGSATVEVSYVYDLTPVIDRLIALEMEIPVESVVIIVSGGAVGIEGENVMFSGMMDTQMGPAASYTAGPLSANAKLQFTTTLIPENELIPPSGAIQQNTYTIQRNPNTEIFIGITSLLISAIISYRIWQSVPVKPIPEPIRPFLLEILDLERSYNEGNLDKSKYDAQRSHLLQNVRLLLKDK